MKKGLVIAITISVLIISVGVGYYIWNNNVKEKEYSSELSSLLNEIELSTAESAIIGATYQKYWGEIIDRSIPISTLSEELKISEEEIEPFINWANRAYFGGSLGSGLEKGNFDTMISIVTIATLDETSVALDNYGAITDKLSSLKNPPSKFESDYKTILDLYETYNTFISLSTDPVGSYIEYSRNLNSTYESVQSKIQTAKIQIQ